MQYGVQIHIIEEVVKTHNKDKLDLFEEGTAIKENVFTLAAKGWVRNIQAKQLGEGIPGRKSKQFRLEM